MHEKLAYLIKHNPFIQIMYRTVMGVCIRFIGIFIKTDDKLVLLSSYGGKQYSDSPRVLFDAMQKDKRFDGFRYVWAFEKPKDFYLEHAEKVKIDSLAYFICALKAKIWITNVNIERGLNFKKKKTVYLNTWHGTGPKKGGNAVKHRKDYDFSRVDIFCCDGEYTHKIFSKWWNVQEDSIFWCGRPREDELVAYTEKDRTHIRYNLKIPSNKKMILYMPTWRESGSKVLNYSVWQEALEKNYVLFVRAHHLSLDDVLKKGEGSFLIDATSYPNINELYCAADILISDYSSAFFDFGLLNKPMYCYAYDYEQYRDEYGLFMDLEKEFPNGIKRTEQEVIDAIIKMDYEAECNKISSYVKQYVAHPESATKCCLDALYRKMELERKR